MPGNQSTKILRTDQGIPRLQNQAGDSPLHSDSTPQPTPPQLPAPSPESSDGDDGDEDLEFFSHFDSLKPNYETFEGQSDDDELSNMDELLELSMKDLTDSMVEFWWKIMTKILTGCPRDFARRLREWRRQESVS
jgi:hypothetical protein